MGFSLVLMWFVWCLFLVSFTKKIFLEMFENIFLRIKCWINKWLLFFITNRCIFLLSKHIVMFWKMHGNAVFEHLEGSNFQKFLRSHPTMVGAPWWLLEFHRTLSIFNSNPGNLILLFSWYKTLCKTRKNTHEFHLYC